PRSVVESHAERIYACVRVDCEVGSALDRAEAEHVDLRIVAAVVRPGEQVATEQLELEAARADAAQPVTTGGIAQRHLAELDEARVLQVRLPDALDARAFGLCDLLTQQPIEQRTRAEDILNALGLVPQLVAELSIEHE